MYLKELLRRHILDFLYGRESKGGEALNGLMLQNMKDLPTLTKAEKKAVKKCWGEIVPPSAFKRGYDFYRICKKTRGFDPRFLPTSYMSPYIINILNPKDNFKTFYNKVIQDMHFQDVNRPVCVLKRLDGQYYSKTNTLLPFSKAVEALAGKNLILKLAESCGGKDILFLDNMEKKNVEELLLKYRGDFIAQELIKQHESTAFFNPDSVNSFRITTLNLNGHTSVISAAFKVGAPGSRVDNLCSAGAKVVVNPDGKVARFGYTADGQEVTTPPSNPDLKFEGYCFPNYSEVLEMAVFLHKRFPQTAIIGWDIALDCDAQPLLIEANMYQPTIRVEQVGGAPIFGDRTQEVIDYCKKNRHLLPKRIFFKYESTR